MVRKYEKFEKIPASNHHSKTKRPINIINGLRLCYPSKLIKKYCLNIASLRKIHSRRLKKIATFLLLTIDLAWRTRGFPAKTNLNSRRVGKMATLCTYSWKPGPKRWRLSLKNENQIVESIQLFLFFFKYKRRI